MPSVPKFMPRRPSGAKFGSPLERLATMKSDKVDSTEKEETARVGSCEKSTKLVSEEAAEICALLKSNLLEDIDSCAKLIGGIRGVVCPSFFCKAYDRI